MKASFGTGPPKAAKVAAAGSPEGVADEQAPKEDRDTNTGKAADKIAALLSDDDNDEKARCQRRGRKHIYGV